MVRSLFTCNRLACGDSAGSGRLCVRDACCRLVRQRRVPRGRPGPTRSLMISPCQPASECLESNDSSFTSSSTSNSTSSSKSILECSSETPFHAPVSAMPVIADVGRFPSSRFSPGRYSPLPECRIEMGEISPCKLPGARTPVQRAGAPKRQSLLSRTASVENTIMAAVAQQLVESHKQATSRRRRLLINLLGSGLVGVLGGLTEMVLAPPPLNRMGMIAILIGIYLFANAILPSDRAAIRTLVCLTTAILAVLITVACAVSSSAVDVSVLAAPGPCRNSTDAMGFCVVEGIENGVVAVALLTSFLFSLWSSRLVRDAKGLWRFALHPRTALVRVWAIARYLAACVGTAWLAGGIGYTHFATDEPGARNFLSASWLSAHLLTAGALLLFALLATARARKAVQKMLAGSRGAAAEAASAAASISAVMGRRGSVVALKEATVRHPPYRGLIPPSNAQHHHASPTPLLSLAHAAQLPRHRL